MWRLNNTFLNNNSVQKNTMKNRKYFAMNENETTAYQSYGMQQTQCLEGNL